MITKKLAGLAVAALCLTAASVALVDATVADASPAKLSPTVKTVVRPVHANGSAVAGWKVTTESIDDFTCSGASASAVDDNIEFCGFSATYTPTCWKSAKHTVLCLRSAYRKELVRIAYRGAFHAAKAPKKAIPQNLTLLGGNKCDIRDGGAWSSVKGHPNWYGDYSCVHGALYGPAKDNGIDSSVNPWRVHELTYTKKGQQHLITRRVAHAYYVGTAA